jgi:hypothetical protein
MYSIFISTIMMIIFYFNLLTGKLGKLSNTKKTSFSLFYTIFYCLYIGFSFYIMNQNIQIFTILNSIFGTFVFVYLTSIYSAKINETVK